jgi:hypothetical protein
MFVMFLCYHSAKILNTIIFYLLTNETMKLITYETLFSIDKYF